MLREEAHFSAAIVGGCARRKDLDGQIWWLTRDRPGFEELFPAWRENEQVGLDDVVLGKDDIEGRIENRNHVDLAVVQLVPATVIRPSLQIRVADARSRSLHRRHSTSSSCEVRAVAICAP